MFFSDFHGHHIDNRVILYENSRFGLINLMICILLINMIDFIQQEVPNNLFVFTLEGINDILNPMWEML